MDNQSIDITDNEPTNEELGINPLSVWWTISGIALFWIVFILIVA